MTTITLTDVPSKLIKKRGTTVSLKTIEQDIAKKYDEDSLEHYQNNPDYIEVNEPIEVVMDFLKKSIQNDG